MEKIFLRSTNIAQVRPSEPHIQIGSIKKTISLIKSKELYNNLILDKIKPPTSVDSWVNLYPFLENYDWIKKGYFYDTLQIY